MTYTDMKSQGIEIQGQIVFCYYDYANEKRKMLTPEEATEYEIKYIYTENDAIYIEVDICNGSCHMCPLAAWNTPGQFEESRIIGCNKELP